jgi:signal transduction histidine kinase
MNMAEQKTEQRHELRRMAEKLAKLIEVSVTLNSTLNLDELLQFIIRTAADILNCQAVSILLYDEKRNMLVFAAATGTDSKQLGEIPVPMEGSLSGHVFLENEPFISTDLEKDAKKYGALVKHVSFDVKNMLAVPMRIKDRPTGVLEALNKRKGSFTEDDADIFSVIASQAAVAVHNSRLVQALQDAYDDIRATDQLKSDFLALASHELRTPLGIIIGYASFLQEESPGELSDHARQVLNTAMQMRSLIDSMTNLNMLRSREMVMHRLVVPIQQVLKAASAEVKSLVEAKNQQVVFEIPEQPIPVKCDPVKLSSVFVNLLDNAVRFTPDNGTITLGATQQNGGAVLAWIKDTGIGLEAGELKKIFKEFYQVEPHTTRRHGGLGIGLTIAQGLVEAHGGRIWAESEGLGKGSTFKVLLPMIPTSSLAHMTPGEAENFFK